MKELVRAFDDHPIRAVVIHGEPWFVAKDVATALGYSNPSDAIGTHCKGVAKRYPLQTPGGIQEYRVLSEPDLYRLIVGSDKPEAIKFEKWIFEEVLPSIRKTGRYSVSAEKRAKSAAARSALTAQWQEHGADKPYHYINLTRCEYKGLYGTPHKHKADMTAYEIAALMAFEAIEELKLLNTPTIQGYHALASSIEATAKVFPQLIASIPKQISGGAA